MDFADTKKIRTLRGKTWIGSDLGFRTSDFWLSRSRFVSECGHGLNLRGSSRRKVTSDQRGGRQAEWREDKSHGVECLHLVDHAPDQKANRNREDQAGTESHCRQAKSFAQHEPKHVPGIRAQSHSDPNFPGASCYHIGFNTVNTDDGQEKRERSKRPTHPGGDFFEPEKKTFLVKIAERLHGNDGQQGIDRADCFAQVPEHRRLRVRVGGCSADMQVHPGAIVLSERNINVRHRHLVIQRIAKPRHHSHYFHREGLVAGEFDLAADRIFGRPEFPGKRLINDGDVCAGSGNQFE